MNFTKIALATAFTVGLSGAAFAQDSACEQSIAKVQDYIASQEAQASEAVASERARQILVWAAEDGNAGNSAACMQHVYSAAGVIGMPL